MEKNKFHTAIALFDFMRFKKGRPFGGLVLLFCLGWMAFTVESGPVEAIRLASFDSYQKISPRQKASAPVTIVAIDEKSLIEYGQWPWPRNLTAQLLANITKNGPASMGFDILLPEPDRLSADKIPVSDNLPKELAALLKEQPNNDEILSDVVRQIPIALGVAGLEVGNLRPGAPITPSQITNKPAIPWLRHYPAELRSLPLIDDKAWGHGLLSVDPDADGIVRRIPLIALIGERIIPSLDLEVLRLAVGANWFSINATQKGIESITVGELEIPTQTDGSLWLHYTASDPTRFVSAADVLNGQVDPEMLANKLVLIGVTGLGLIDYPATPVVARMPGVEVRAQLLENIFDNQILKRPSWAGPSEIGLLIIIGGIMIWCVPKISPKISPVILIGSIIFCLGAGFAAYKSHLILLDTTTPALGSGLVFIAMFTTVIFEIDRQRRLFKQEVAIQKEREEVMGAIDYGVIFMNADLEIRLVNHTGMNMWGYDEAFIASRPTMLELIHYNKHNNVYPVAENDFGEFASDFNAKIFAGPIPSTEIELTTGRILRYQNFVLTDGGRMLTFLDITETVLAKRELLESYDVISSSIEYASRIQRSILPESSLFISMLSDYFVIWEPRDVVGGDIYWCRPWGDGLLIILGDCTGHGVPGAFMTLISTGALDQALTNIPEGNVNQIMQQMHQLIQKTLGQDGRQTESDDGLELGMCYLSENKEKLIFSGARFDLYVVLNGEIEKYAGGRKGIGYPEVPSDIEFKEISVDIDPETSFYMTTDGLIDQLGELTHRSFGKKRFQKLLLDVNQESMIDQKEIIYKTLLDYQGDVFRLDDVGVIGFKIHKEHF